MRIPRRDMELNDALEALDQRLIEAQSISPTKSDVIPTAWSLLTSEESAFINTELDRCITDRRYFMENYYAIRDESGRIHTLYPFWDHQEMIMEEVEYLWKTEGCVRLIILKPRQAGSTTWNSALISHATLTVPNTFSLVMAQDNEVSNEIYQRMIDALHSMPWWMVPEMASKQQGNRIIFQRDDEQRRQTDPGMGSTLMISNAQRSSGVAIGRTVRNILASEVSRWPDPTVWTADIKPSLNAPDMLGILESTANGRAGLYWNMWNGAMEGNSIWHGLFIPVYRVRKYFLPVYRKEKFQLTPEERGLRERVAEVEKFKIPLGFFKWRRREIVETIKSTGSEESHYESYPITPEEAFINSGFCSFPKRELSRQLRVYARDPDLVGEIEYTGKDTPPALHLHTPEPLQLKNKPEKFNRLWVWEEPLSESDLVTYYIGGDVGGGEEGNDYSSISVWKLGYNTIPDELVANWHGHMNPSHLARAIAALGQWYHTCEVAVEYAQSGITTCNELQWTLDYPNLYRWKLLDKIGSTMTLHTHWMTTERTRSDAINRMNERLLDHTIIIRDRFMLEEMRDFGTEGGYGKAQGLDNNDDYVMSALIAMGAASQSGKRREMSEAAQTGTSLSSQQATSAMPKGGSCWGVYDQFSRQVAQTDSEAAGQDVIIKTAQRANIDPDKLHWTVQQIPVMKANTIWTPALDDPNSAASSLYREGIPLKNITPELVQMQRGLMNTIARRGGNALGAGNGMGMGVGLDSLGYYDED